MNPSPLLSSSIRAHSCAMKRNARIILLAGFTAINLLASPQSSDQKAATVERVEVPVVTMAQFKQLRNGMKYEQVSAILGSMGEERSESKVMWITMVMYQWVNADGSNITVFFKNGKLNVKAQARLR